MAYLKESLGSYFGEKVYVVLLKNGFTMREAQRLCDSGRVSCETEILSKSDIANGEIFLLTYQNNPRGLTPFFQTKDFAVFDKPSGVLSHPNGRRCEYSLCDEIWSLWGQGACVAHRLDRETSGVIIAAKNKNSAKGLKQIFESRAVAKSYLAVVEGVFEPEKLALNSTLISPLTTEKLQALQDEFPQKILFFNAEEELQKPNLTLECVFFVIDAGMRLTSKYDDLKIRMVLDEDGKRAVTLVRVVERLAQSTLVECFTLTGRQHQIRLHLHSIGHKILGEPIYGLQRREIERILDKQVSEEERVRLSGASRLMLHAQRIKFEFGGEVFDIFSQMKFV